MLDSLRALLDDPEFADACTAIQAGISKAEDYAVRTNFTDVPAYTLATSKHSYYEISGFLMHDIFFQS